MGRYSWILGGGLGFVLGGPIGMLIGAGLGYMYGESQAVKQQSSGKQQRTGYRQHASRGDFSVSFLVLIAAVMKADGKVVRSELDYVKSQFLRLLGPSAAKDALRMLGDLIKQEIPVRDVCYQIRQNMDHATRLQMLHLLMGISAADGRVAPEELELIKRIAHYLNISEADFNSIKSMFVSDVYWPYKILEIAPESSNEDVKKAYRKMALKFHPDKVSHLGDEFAEQAKEKFQKVNDAYNKIKTERGF